jgi:hypothetical protein
LAVNENQAPEGMIPVEQFAKRKGLAVDRAIAMIRDGFYVGQVVGERWYAREDQIDGVPASAKSTNVGGGSGTPALVVVFYILSGLSLLGGIILASEFWPGDPGYGREWNSVAYAWSIVWLTVGLVEAALFAAIGKGLSLLQQIVKNTEK